ncbi:MAG TPA: 50S ribosomal protein L25 [Acidimicrobiales bacterium]|nr:50S ribosomal protein L25 [Acidimicrobiales bacterium]
MAEIALVTEVRTERGSAACRRLRAAGRVPAVVYGRGLAPLAVSVDARALRAALSTEAGANAVFNLQVGGTSHLAMAREIQHHPVRHTVTHVDFHVVARDELVSAEVPLVLTGEAVAVQRAGGTVEHLLLAVPIKAKPADIPAAFEVDVSAMAPGDTLDLASLALPAGVRLEADPATLVAVAHAGRLAAAGAGEAAEAEGGTS